MVTFTSWLTDGCMQLMKPVAQPGARDTHLKVSRSPLGCMVAGKKMVAKMLQLHRIYFPIGMQPNFCNRIMRAWKRILQPAKAGTQRGSESCGGTSLPASTADRRHRMSSFTWITSYLARQVGATRMAISLRPAQPATLGAIWRSTSVTSRGVVVVHRRDGRRVSLLTWRASERQPLRTSCRRWASQRGQQRVSFPVWGRSLADGLSVAGGSVTRSHDATCNRSVLEPVSHSF